MDRFETHRRIRDALLIFAEGYRPFVEGKMQARYDSRWVEEASLAHGTSTANPLDGYALCKTTLDRWNEVFRACLEPPVRNRKTGNGEVRF